jgi:serine/threonine-protein kinase
MLGPTHSQPRAVGRYLLAGPIAVGGMASVHFGKLNGPKGFRRTVAIKRMLQTYATNPQARLMLVDEARLASRVAHGNVVQTLDVVEEQDELFLVLEYVHGESFDKLLERAAELGQRAPRRVVAAILVGVLRGLHAAHEAKGEDGQPLDLVHRDLSPHNVLVDVNGVPRVLDFGVARARGRLQGTRDGQLKGKLAYLAPEQVHGDASRRSDLFTAGVVLWEALTGRQLFQGKSEADLLSQVLLCKVPPLADAGVDAPDLQAVLDRALAREPQERFATAAEMADALEACGTASASEVAAWVADMAADTLAQRSVALEALDQLPAPDALVRPVDVAPSPPRGRAPLVALVVVALVAAAATVAFVSQRSAPEPAVASPSASAPTRAAEPPAPVGGGPTVATPDVTGPTVATPAPVAGPTVAAPTPVAGPTVAAPTPPAKGPTKPHPPPTEPAVARPAETPAPSGPCDPPFTIDASGVKRFKVECLK